MSDSAENYYYEIALTSRQVLVSFVVLLFCVLASFILGIWVGKKGGGQALAAESSAASPESSEIADLDTLEEFRFGPGDTLDKPDLSELRDTPAGGASDPGADPAPPSSESGSAAGDRAPPARESTLAQDIGSEPDRPRGGERQQRRASPPASRPSTQPPAPSATVSTAAPAGEGFVVQVFSTRDQNQAQRVLERLRQGGYERAFLSPVQVANQTMYRVRVGPFADRPPAEKVAKGITDEYKLETWITAASN